MKAKLNVPEETVRWQIQRNVCRGEKQVVAHLPNDNEIALCCGGPSLETEFDTLQSVLATGAKPVAVNGTHDWLLDRGITPSAQVLCDAREHNKRFVQRPVETCKYFLGSQCHPAVYDTLDGQDVYQFHVYLGIGEEQIARGALGAVPMIVGGSTVGSRAFHLFRVLGFRKFHVFGMDSCYMDGRHHAYPQKENDFDHDVEFEVAGEKFIGDIWMLHQFKDFLAITIAIGDLFQVKVYGNGAIATAMEYIANTGDVSWLQAHG